MERSGSVWFRRVFPALVVGAGLIGAATGYGAPPPDLDTRMPKDPRSRGGHVLRSPGASRLVAADRLAAELPGLVLRWNGMSGSPAWVGAPAGRTLSPPAAGEPEVLARGFLAAHADLFGLRPAEIAGLRVVRSVPSPDGGAYVRFVQRVGPLEVFGARGNVSLDPRGAIRSAGTTLYAGLRAPGAVLVEPTDAVLGAVRQTYPQIAFVGQVAEMDKAGERRVVFSDPGFGRPPSARLVLFPEAQGARPAWEVRIAEPTLRTDYVILVDALDGHTLYRRNLTVHAGARVLTTEDPEPETEEVAPGTYVLQTIASTTPESPSGWITGDGSSLAGNNAVSHLGYYTAGGLAEPSAVYDYPYDSTSSALVNAWYWLNDAHDRFYGLGFDEAHGNYQQDNFGKGGTGGDPLHVVAYDSGPRDDAFFSVSDDGGVSTANFLWAVCYTCGDHDGYPENGGERSTGFMRDLLYHEYTHGVSGRIIGGSAGCVSGVQPGALGEAWSDIYAASFEDDPEMFGHFYEGLGWARDARQDLGYGDLCRVGDHGCEVHEDGMIWFGALWDLRNSMIALDPVSGGDQLERLLVQGMEATPCGPTYLDARDALLNADTTLYGSAHHKLIWRAMAARGMGTSASSTGPGDAAPVPASDVPTGMECTLPTAATGLTAQASAANTITLRYSASGASAVEILRRDTGIPWSVSERIAFGTDLATFDDTTVQGGRTYEYRVVSLGDAGVGCAAAPSPAAQATATGSCQAYPVFDPNLAVSDGDASCALALSWSAASPGCAGEPIVYDVYRAPVPGYEPSDRVLIGRTTATSFQDLPPADGQVPYYLVLAQHGTLSDPPDHRFRGKAQVLRWVPRVPMLGRTTVQFWDFESGASGWMTDNTDDPPGAWTLAAPTGTRYGGTVLAPDSAAGGAGQAWVTGDDPAPASVTAHDCDGENVLTSPAWDSTGGATIVSFDYWAHVTGSYEATLEMVVTTSSEQVWMDVAGFLTVQPFETSLPTGWQHAEVDIATLVTPDASTRVSFVPLPSLWAPLTEFGIDNVRVERASACSRSSLAVTAVSVDDTAPGWGNGNGILEPGETARLIVEVSNGGVATAFAPSGTLRSGASDLLVHEATDHFPDVPSGGTGTSLGDGFTVSVPALACGETVNLGFELTDTAGTRTVQAWPLETGDVTTSVVATDDFETDNGWTQDGASGGGMWQRGDPVGTFVGSDPANPENDSPNDAGAQCYVTENGPVGGNPDANDVDASYTTLFSPLLDLTGYKRAWVEFDLWYYDDSSTGDVWEDLGEWGAGHDDAILSLADVVGDRGLPTNGWEPVRSSLVPAVPMVADVYLAFRALDQDETWDPAYTDHTVEMGVDNVRVLGDLPLCAAPGVSAPPNGVGTSVRMDRTAGGEPRIYWTAPASDATHDPAAYYEIWVSGNRAGGFGVGDTATLTEAVRASSPGIEYILVTAVNAAGASADQPAP